MGPASVELLTAGRGFSLAGSGNLSLAWPAKAIDISAVSIARVVATNRRFIEVSSLMRQRRAARLVRAAPKMSPIEPPAIGLGMSVPSCRNRLAHDVFILTNEERGRGSSRSRSPPVPVMNIF